MIREMEVVIIDDIRDFRIFMERMRIEEEKRLKVNSPEFLQRHAEIMQMCEKAAIKNDTEED